jgi:hypothetical protein
MSQFKALLFRKARGKCFKCLSPEHRVAECRNLAKCLLCGEFGHKARWCPGEQVKKTGRPAAGVQVSEAAAVLRAARAADSSTASQAVKRKKLGGMEALQLNWRSPRNPLSRLGFQEPKRK